MQWCNPRFVFFISIGENILSNFQFPCCNWWGVREYYYVGSRGGYNSFAQYFITKLGRFLEKLLQTHVTYDMWYVTTDMWHIYLFLFCFFCPFSFCFGICATIRTRRENKCLLYAGFLMIISSFVMFISHSIFDLAGLDICISNKILNEIAE